MLVLANHMKIFNDKIMGNAVFFLGNTTDNRTAIQELESDIEGILKHSF